MKLKTLSSAEIILSVNMKHVPLLDCLIDIESPIGGQNFYQRRVHSHFSAVQEDLFWKKAHPLIKKVQFLL
jgi:hypothetical protein